MGYVGKITKSGYKSFNKGKMRMGLNPIEKKQVQNLISKSEETKWATNTWSSGSITTTAALDSITPNISQGDNNGERIGNKITVSSMRLRAALVQQPGEAVRVLIAQYKDGGPSGGAADFFGSGGTAAHPVDFNLCNSRILYDKYLTTGHASAQPVYQKFDLNIAKLKGFQKVLRYESSTDTQPNNAIVVVVVGSNASGTSGTLANASLCTMFYKD